MRQDLDRARREQTTLTLAIGQQQTIAVNGDYFYIENITASIELGVNGGTFAVVTDGDSLQAAVGSGYIQTLTFNNTSGAECVITIIHGVGVFGRTANATIQNPNFTLSSAQVADLKNVTLEPAAGSAITLTDEEISNNTKNYTGYKALRFENTGTGGDVTVNGHALGIGEFVQYDVGAGELVGNLLPTIALDATGGATFKCRVIGR